MTGLYHLAKRNCKLYFKDKGLFLSSLLTPIILLVLYATFLANVYRSSIVDSFPTGLVPDEKLINAIVGGQLISALLAVCCVTVAFCSNLIMIQDKVTGARTDLTVTPVKRTTLAVSYFTSTLLSTLGVCVVALAGGMGYLAVKGWYLSAADVCFILLDVFLLCSFGTLLSSIVNMFLSTQGQMSAVGTIVSAGYGFISGAYMPISQFGEGLRNVLGFLPGTYGTALLKNHALRGAFEQLEKDGCPVELADGIREAVDCRVFFFGNEVKLPLMYVILGGTVVLLLAIYILMNCIFGKRTAKAVRRKNDKERKN